MAFFNAVSTGGVNFSLGHLQDVSAQQIKTYDKHIDTLVTAATQQKKH
jgi:hypothetical protein